MKKKIVRAIIRAKLKRQSVEKGSAELKKWGEKYLELGKGLTEEQASKTVTVPEMMGVDSDMTNWSYYQLLEHNTIVNNTMSLNVGALMTGKGKRLVEKFNPKTDVLPSADAGREQVELFQQSIEYHIDIIREFEDLNSEGTNTHPVFGDFNAHMWHGMMGVHLGVHYKQAKMIVGSK